MNLTIILQCPLKTWPSWMNTFIRSENIGPYTEIILEDFNVVRKVIKINYVYYYNIYYTYLIYIQLKKYLQILKNLKEDLIAAAPKIKNKINRKVIVSKLMAS